MSRPTVVRLLGSQAISTIGVATLFLLSLLFYVVAVRVFSPEHVAEVITLLTVVTGIGILQSTVSSYILMRSKEGHDPFVGVRTGFRNGAVLAFCMSAVILSGAPLLRAFFHLESSTSLLPLPFVCFIAVTNGTLQGMLSARRNIAALAFMSSVETLFRIVGMLCLSLLPYYPAFPSIMVIVGGMGSLGVGLAFTRRDLSKIGVHDERRSSSWSFFVACISGAALLNVIFQLFVLWPKHALGTQDAAVMVFLLKIATLYAAGVLAAVSATGILLHKNHVRWFLFVSLAEISATLVAVLGVCWLWGDALITAAFGAQYAGHIPLLALLMAAAAAYAAVVLSSSFLTLLHHEKTSALFLGLTAAALSVCERLFGHSDSAIGWTLLFVFGSSSFIMLTYLFIAAPRLRDEGYLCDEAQRENRTVSDPLLL